MNVGGALWGDWRFLREFEGVQRFFARFEAWELGSMGGGYYMSGERLYERLGGFMSG
ncbi:hypothetical protein ABE073_16335 [Lederbergia citrisecunda]|uniref:hypothetical protein n=1 Tax=Lederbergia citrisecunda TaxID=2833583 RepID=UPI003D2BB346